MAVLDLDEEVVLDFVDELEDEAAVVDLDCELELVVLLVLLVVVIEVGQAYSSRLATIPVESTEIREKVNSKNDMVSDQRSLRYEINIVDDNGNSR